MNLMEPEKLSAPQIYAREHSPTFTATT